MPYRVRIILIFLALYCCWQGALAQVTGQFDAAVSIRGVPDARPDRLVFDLTITRLTDQWDRWANGTFRIDNPAFSQTGGLTESLHEVVLVPGSSALPLRTYDATAMDAYAIVPRIANGRASIMILGPDSAGNAWRLLERNKPYVLGRFELRTKDGSQLIGSLDWTAPYSFYQANAFKIDHDSVTGEGSGRNVWYSNHDNIELFTRYDRGDSTGQCDSVFVQRFAGEYVGDMTVNLSFTTQCEVNTAGFFIERSLAPGGRLTGLSFEPREQLDHQNNASLRACACPTGRDYLNLLDGVEYRREYYAYRLASRELNTGTVRYHDTILVRIPSPIISNAQLLDNPFSDRTSARFNADDRLRLTAGAYDLGGRLITYLKDENGQPIINKEYAKGQSYLAVFDAESVASAGMYNLILIAVPFDETAVEEQSRVVLKAQLVR